MGRLDSMKGGGFLNNVDGTLVDYEFTNTFPGQEEDPDQLFGVLTVKLDGADESVQTTLRYGSARYIVIEDPHTVVNPEGSPARIWDKSDGYRFHQSIEEAGIPDGGIDSTDLDRLSFTSLIGRRMRFVQERDEERMEARRKAGQNPKRVDKKTNKEYDFTRLTVERVYDVASQVVPSGTPATRPTVSGKGAGAVKPVGRGQTAAASRAGGNATTPSTPYAKGGKANGATAAEQVIDDEATEVLRGVLAANQGTVLRSDLARLVTTTLLQAKNPRREVLRKRIYSPEFLGTNRGWVFDEVGQTVELRATEDLPF